MSGGLRLAEHLDELRRRMKVVFISLIVAVLLVLLLPLRPWELFSLTTIYYATPVSLFLQGVVHDTLPAGWALIPLTVGAPLEVLLYASLILGLAVDMPVISYEAYRFVDPALKPEEKATIYPVIISATVLFLVGILFGYFVLARFIFVAMAPFYTAVGLTPPYYIAVSDYYSIVFLSVLFSGGAFTSPVFVFLLIKFGVVSPRFFRKNRVLIWGVAYAVTAFVTPDGGPILDLILFVPVIVLLEAAVLIGKRYAPAPTESRLPRCRFCAGEIGLPALFCPNCGKGLA
ncbi:MAG: twin-arginine translocase subunit TatC [Thaumarchaeota archaeon]|nr:twin-arginine translocase subunit TatC [Nitrososphaerota archaeon]